MKKLTVQYWPLERFRFYERDLKKTDKAVERMEQAMREYGFRLPVLARGDGEVIDGRTRILAARRLDLAEAPVVVADDLTEAQVRAFRLLVNRSAAWAEWDEEVLRLELLELREIDVDLRLTGFEAEELAGLLRDLGEDDGGEEDRDVYREQYGVIVMCEDEARQCAVYDRLTGLGYVCRVVVT